MAIIVCVIFKNRYFPSCHACKYHDGREQKREKKRLATLFMCLFIVRIHETDVDNQNIFRWVLGISVGVYGQGLPR